MEFIKHGEKNIRIVAPAEIEDAVARLFTDANYTLTKDVTDCISCALEKERVPIAKKVLSRILDNVDAAKEISVPVCQDTGMAVVFAYVGDRVFVDGNIEEAINKGVRRAYVDGALRLSVVRDPLYDRVNTNDNTPAIIHIRIVKGENIRIVALPKGFGSENMSALKMFTPSATEEDVINFVTDTVVKAGSNPCPPIVVGVGIGGDFEQCAILAKECFCRPIDDENPSEKYAALEKKLLEKINLLNIGPQGFSGDTTALAVKVSAAPTHIAGLPVAVNINCHVIRHAETTI
ncbi:MAG: fumarate hydratase [Clostridia bacterium]|nr:fumarate hydratase [Clostridia bacterium]